jgi:hypothetical protein
MALSICSRCQRHVKGEGACPFCGGATTSPALTREPAGRLSRAAMLFGVAAVSAACTTAVAMYGAPGPVPDRDSGATDGGGDARSDAAPSDAATDAEDGGPVAMYGAPAPDAASDAEAPDGGGIALYGAPAL